MIQDIAQTAPAAEFAVLMINIAGQAGELPDAVQYDMPDEEIQRIATEAISGGITGIDAQVIDFTGYRVERKPAKDGLPNRLILRPKTAFGNI